MFLHKTKAECTLMYTIIAPIIIEYMRMIMHVYTFQL